MWKPISVCIQGTSHKNKGIPCQDVVKIKNQDEECVLVLSDGAGSARYSQSGAEIVCKAILDFFRQDFSWIFNSECKILQEKIIHRIRTRLGMRAKVLNTYKDELASTLCFVAVKGNLFICGHIGDGVIGAIETNNTVKLLSAADRGEFANTTYFTTTKNYYAHFRLYKGDCSKYKSFFIMSDGAADCLYDRRNDKFAKAITIFSSWIEHYSVEEVNKALCDNLIDFIPKHTTDDCSFAMCQLKDDI